MAAFLRKKNWSLGCVKSLLYKINTTWSADRKTNSDRRARI